MSQPSRFINFGIDHGTSNSAIAIMEPAGPRIISPGGFEPTMPSVVFVRSNGRVLVGAEARKAMMAGRDGEGEGYGAYKPVIGQKNCYNFPSSRKVMNAPELGAQVLGALLRAYEEEIGYRPQAGVITVPAMFKRPEREGTREAALLAGLSHVEMLQEPVAAALACGYSAIDTKAQWIVFDLGAGTLDVSLVLVRNGDLIVPEKGNEGHNRLGGTLFDRDLLDFVLGPVRSDPKYESTLARYRELQPDYAPLRHLHKLDSFNHESHKQAWGRLLLAVEEAKIVLSNKHEAVVETGELMKDEAGKPVKVEFRITRSAYERIIAPHIERAVGICQNLLRRNRLKPQDITSMILIGGPTRTPFIRQVLQDRLELSLKDDVDPMTAVALGAAIYASTKEIPLELRRNGPVPAVNDAPGCVVKLEYEPSAREPMHFVAGRIVAADLCVGFSVDVRRSDGLWTSESIPVGEDGLFTTEILLVSGAGRILSRFETLVRDASGRIRARVPEPHVWYPMGETVMAVPNSLLVGLEDNRTFSLVAAGSALPLEVSKGPFFTTKSLAKGSGEDMLRIPILEGVTNHLGEENETADCNLHIGTLVIEGNDMKVTRDLPTGSEVELSIRVDASQRITVMAEIPHLDEEFPATFEHEATLSPLPALRSRFEGLQQEIQRMRNLETRHPQSEIRETLDRLDLIGVVSQIDTQLKRAEGSEVGTKEDAHEQVLKLAGTLHLVSKLQARARIEDLAASLAGLCPAEHQSELSDLRSTLASTPNEDHEGLKRLEASFHNLDLRIRTGPCLDLLLDIIAIGGKRITPAQNETLREAVKLGERFIESDGGRKLSRSEVEDMSRMHDKLMRAHPELPAWRNEKLASMGGDLSQAADQLRGSDLQC